MKPTLTPEQRAWLDHATNPATQLVADIINAFIAQFDLSPRVAGQLLAIWIMENRK